MRLKPRIILATMALVTLIVGLTGGLFLTILQRTLMNQIGENALDVSRSVARMPAIRDAMLSPHPSEVIQPIAESIREATGATFIVVGNQTGTRYSHPDPTKIGQSMVGGDNGGALVEGREYVSVADGSLGRSLRGKVPILDERDQVIGVVSVGFLLTEVDRTVSYYQRLVLLVLALGLAVGVPGAWAMAASIKRATHGLEPKEIAALAEERHAILGAIREGIIAIDGAGLVVVANETARDLVRGLDVGVTIQDVLPNARMPEVLAGGQPEFDQHLLIDDTTVIANLVPVRIADQVTGVVATFRDRSELERLTRELHSTRRYTEELRAQAHEFHNTLQAVSGMIQLGRPDEAVDFIQDVTETYRQLVEAMPKSIADTAVAALLLGKRARAEELHCEFTLDASSSLDGRLPSSKLLVRVVGNLLDNALEAVAHLPLENRHVRVRLADENGMVCVEVADSGPGVPPDLAEGIFREGFSTKASGR
ncbi:MAG TPA: sensor histidine kinase, partial [Symbiobacteriaceae bacterium]|nr:sensor histidine kinase [Symbiobacteriaceae bacterium]